MPSHNQPDPVGTPARLLLREVVSRGDLPLVDELVTGDYTATGTHDGTLVGVEPTGREIEVAGVYVARVEDGKLTRGWDMWDGYGLLVQVGALPEQLDD